MVRDGEVKWSLVREGEGRKKGGGGDLIKGGRGFYFDEGDETRPYHIEQQRWERVEYYVSPCTHQWGKHEFFLIG